jgi:hypothetical protein
MKTTALLFLALSVNLFASDLSPDLKPIQAALISENDAPSLIGKEYTANLTLKFASSKHLIFSDANLPIDAETKYQIAKWIFTPDLAKNYIGKKDLKCAVSFRISGVNTDDKKMPYIVADVTAIESK